MEFPSKLLKNLVYNISQLSGIGKRSALRIALEILRKPKEFSRDLSESILDFKTQIKHCEQCHNISDKDVVIGIAASGTTPYVIHALKACNSKNIITGCITCNAKSPLSYVSKFPMEVIVGPEFVTGSSRMNAGTAQKLVLNMITTATMIQLGKIKGNKMVDMQLSNQKLVNRGTQMLANELDISESKAKNLLNKYGNVRNAINNFNHGRD